jgi:hypothetical protein
VFVCFGGIGGPARGAPDTCHAEFGIGRPKQQTRRVTVASRRALCAETDRCLYCTYSESHCSTTFTDTESCCDFVADASEFEQQLQG